MAKRVSHKGQKPAKRVERRPEIRAGAEVESEMLEASAEDLKICSEAFYRAALELGSVARGIEAHGVEPHSTQGLRRQALDLQAQSQRAALSALSARAVGERLETVARLREAADE